MDQFGDVVARIITGQKVELQEAEQLQDELASARARLVRGYQRVSNAILRETFNRGKFKEVAEAVAKVLAGRDEAPLSYDDVADAGGFSRSTARRGLRYFVNTVHALTLVEQGGGRVDGKGCGKANVYAVTPLWLAWFPEARSRARARAEKLETLRGAAREHAQPEHPADNPLGYSTPPSPLQGGEAVSSPGGEDGHPVGSASLPEPPPAAPEVDRSPDVVNPGQEDKAQPHGSDTPEVVLAAADPVATAEHYLVSRGYPPAVVEVACRTLRDALDGGLTVHNPGGWAERVAHRVRVRADELAAAEERKRLAQAREDERRTALAQMEDGAVAEYAADLERQAATGGALTETERIILRLRKRAPPADPVGKA